MCLQSWATLRFDDHRGMVPSDMDVSETGKSLRPGQETQLQAPCRSQFSLDLLASGWKILEQKAPLPEPTNNFRGLKRKELKYEAAFGIQSQITSLLSNRGPRVFRASTESCITSPEFDPLAEADDIDGLGHFLKSCPDQEVLRVKKLLVCRTFTDVVRDDTPEVPTVQLGLAPEELAPDKELDERLS